MAPALLLMLPLVPIALTRSPRAPRPSRRRPAGAIPTPDVDGHAGPVRRGASRRCRTVRSIVGDYWNGRVVHFAANGTSLGTLFNIAPAVRPGRPEHHPVRDGRGPDTGSVYVGTYYISPKIPSVIQRWVPGRSGDYSQIAPISHWGSCTRRASRSRTTAPCTWRTCRRTRSSSSTPRASFQFAWGSKGSGPGQFNQPRGIAFDRSSPQRLYVADATNKRVQVFSPSGQFLFQFGQAGTVAANKLKVNLRGLAVDRRSRAVYVVDITSQTVFKFDLDGAFERKIGTAGGLNQTQCCSTPGGQFSNGGPRGGASTATATSGSATCRTSACRCSARTGRTCSRARTRRRTRRPVASTPRAASRWTRPATCSSPTTTTSGSRSSAPRAR